MYHAVGVSGNEKKLALQLKAVAILSRCFNTSDDADPDVRSWKTFVDGSGGRFQGATMPLGRCKRTREVDEQPAQYVAERAKRMRERERRKRDGF